METKFFKQGKSSGKRIAGMLLAGICCVSAFAEEGDSQTIIGKVLDNKGMGLPGVTVLQKNTSNGTVTDIDGNFSIDVTDP